MNIKTVTTGPLLPVDPKNRVEGGVRTKSSTDRDANGKREAPEGETKQKLTDEEFKEALDVLKELPGLKANDLVVRIEMQDTVRVVLIEDRNGKVVRRLSEGQLWLATQDKERLTGKILDKAV